MKSCSECIFGYRAPCDDCSDENENNEFIPKNIKTILTNFEAENAKLKQELEVHKKALLGLAIRVRESEKLTIPAETIAEIFLTELGKELSRD